MIITHQHHRSPTRAPMAALFFLLLATAVALGQTGTASTPTNSNAPNGVANTPGTSGSAMAASNDLRILSPKVGQKIGASDISVRYELTNTNADAASSPTYRVQLDGRDPVETLDTSSSFNGLAPGPHSLTIELVDANHTPITGSQAVVHFTTFLPGVNGSNGTGANGTNPPRTNGTTPDGTASPAKPHTTSSLTPPPVVKAKMPLPSESAEAQLPSAGGELPLLSMVGFGVLVGGVISAMRTRKQ
jgi:hypothetical protein